MKNIAIITARGGSKRIPKKNIKEFFGRPVISYSIQAAINSNLFDEVMVSTDSDEIAEIARAHGASVPFMRSEKNSNDYATTADALIEVINAYKEKDFVYDNICCIYPVAPLIRIAKLKSAYALMLENKYDSVLPVAEYSTPIQWALKLNDSGKISPFTDKYLKMRSQDIEDTYFDVGMFYWMKTSSIVKNHRILCDNSGAIVIPEMEMQDIDTEADWKLAELKYKLMHNERT